VDILADYGIALFLVMLVCKTFYKDDECTTFLQANRSDKALEGLLKLLNLQTLSSLSCMLPL